MTSVDFVIQLSTAIETATRSALTELFKGHPETFYYISLITTAEGHPPALTAWSEEALNRAIDSTVPHSKKSREQIRFDLEWSYGESPYYTYGDEFFAHVRDLIETRPSVNSMNSSELSEEVSYRLLAAEAALMNLDRAGFFNIFGARRSLVINAEVMPPCRENTTRGIRLNPPEAIREWLSSVAEPI